MPLKLIVSQGKMIYDLRISGAYAFLINPIEVGIIELSRHVTTFSSF